MNIVPKPEFVGFTLNTPNSLAVPGRWTWLALCGYEPAIYAAMLEQEYSEVGENGR